MKNKNLANPRLGLDNQAQMDNVLLKVKTFRKNWGGEGLHMYITEHTIYIRNQNLQATVHI